jgi:hypothetical protein
MARKRNQQAARSGSDPGSAYRRKGLCFFLDALDQFLDGVHFLFLEVGFATLFAHPCGHFIQYEMAAFPVDVERRRIAFHFTLAIKALHLSNLALKL